MGKIVDFKTQYAQKVFAITPNYCSQGSFGWAIINTDAAIFDGVTYKPFISHSGIIESFSMELSLRTMNELCKKFIDVWRKDSGFSKEPIAMVVERPVGYRRVSTKPRAIEKFNVLAGMLLKILNPRFQISPSYDEWKQSQKKEDTLSEIISLLDYNDEPILKRDLQATKPLQHNSLFDAIGLGVYGARVLTKKASPPDMMDLNDTLTI